MSYTLKLFTVLGSGLVSPVYRCAMMVGWYHVTSGKGRESCLANSIALN